MPGRTRASTFARWLAALGYTAFLLKYRVQASPADQAAFEAAMAAIDAGLAVPRPKAQKPGAIGDVISTRRVPRGA